MKCMKCDNDVAVNIEGIKVVCQECVFIEKLAAELGDALSKKYSISTADYIVGILLKELLGRYEIRRKEAK